MPRDERIIGIFKMPRVQPVQQRPHDRSQRDQEPSALLIALRTAKIAGLDEAQLRNMLAGNVKRIAAGEAPLPPTPATGSDTFSQPMVFARIHQYISMTTPLLWTRQRDTIGLLGLAINACAERNGHAEAVDRIHELLVAARDLWASVPEMPDEVDQWTATRLTFRLIHLADIEAVTANA